MRRPAVELEVQLKDGVHIELNSGETVVADANTPNGDINIVTHAHGDHLFSTPTSSIICSELTAALGVARRDCSEISRTTSNAVELHNAGHVAGSRAALIKDSNQRILYTGDISTRDRFFLNGFEPVDADILIIESTYGEPEYEFPAHEEVAWEIVDWLNETQDSPVVLFGYSLGRAQELQLLANRADRGGEVYISEAIETINRVIESHLPISFNTTRYESNMSIGPGDVLVLPSQTKQLEFVSNLIESEGAITAAASGWAVNESYKYRLGLDKTFPLSDHCDFTELLDVVAAVDPDIVYTHHGANVQLAKHITSQLGYTAQPLLRNQSTLTDF